jgi:hypothetical protein
MISDLAIIILDGITEVSIIGGLEVDGVGIMVLIIGGIILFGIHIITTLHLDRALIMAFITLITGLFRILTGSIIIAIIVIQE